MIFELYRNTTIGTCFQEALNEIFESYGLSDSIYEQTLMCFDQVIDESLYIKVKMELQINGKLLSYRFCDNVWTLIIKEAEFKGANGD